MPAGGGPRLPGGGDAATMPQVKLGITLKLFLAILAACAAAAAAMAIATRLSFQSGFVGYLEQRDLQRVDTLTAKLAEEYRRTGGWDFIRGDYARLLALAIADQPAPRLSVLDHAG